MKYIKNYRKNPVEIRAVINDGSDDCFLAIANRPFNTGSTVTQNNDGTINVKTLEGVMKANVGDYVICGINGELYPCKPDVFKKTYTEILYE